MATTRAQRYKPGYQNRKVLGSKVTLLKAGMLMRLVYFRWHPLSWLSRPVLKVARFNVRLKGGRPVFWVLMFRRRLILLIRSGKEGETSSECREWVPLDRALTTSLDFLGTADFQRSLATGI